MLIWKKSFIDPVAFKTVKSVVTPVAMSILAVGVVVPNPIRLFSASIESVFESKFSAFATLFRVHVDAAAEVRFIAPEEFSVTTPVPDPMFEVPVEDNVVKAPVLGVPLPMGPGAAKVAPLSDEAFKFATFVVEVTTNGAVPVARVEVICPEAFIVVIPDNAPALIINPFIVSTLVGPLNAPAEVIVPVLVVEIFPGVVIFPEVKVTPVAPVMAPSPVISNEAVFKILAKVPVIKIPSVIVPIVSAI
jgi:hypothetical protein